MVERRRRGVRTALVGEALRVALAARERTDPGAGLDIVDLGGGTGGFAVPLAVEGHSVVLIQRFPGYGLPGRGFPGYHFQGTTSTGTAFAEPTR